jgi:isovaleryl-CoA dehydrogenase
MDFDLSPEQSLLQDTVRQFVEREVRPLAERIDREDRFPMELWPKLGALGVLGIGVDEAYGGSGGDMMDAVLVGEALSAGSSGIALSMGAHSNLCVYNLYRNGDEAQRRRWLPALCAGEKVGALCITEPDTGSDAVGMATTARRVGDRYLLNGSKTWITNAPIADLFLVYAKTRPEAGARGISAFLVERGAPGLGVSKPFEKLGCRGSPTGELSFQDCEVPAENLLGAEHGGVHVLMSGLDVERAVFASLPVGQAQRALDLSLRYARERRQFGKPIGEHQLVAARLADMYTRVEASRLMVYRAATALAGFERGGRGSPIHRLAASSLLFAAEAAEKVVYDAVQIHGGNGYSAEFEVSRLYRDVRLGTIGAGTSEIRRLIIARELLGG